MNQYELMWIVGSDADENSSSELKDSLTKKIEVSGGSIAVIESYGKRTSSRLSNYLDVSDHRRFD